MSLHTFPSVIAVTPKVDVGAENNAGVVKDETSLSAANSFLSMYVFAQAGRCTVGGFAGGSIAERRLSAADRCGSATWLRSDERRGRLFKSRRLPPAASVDSLCRGSRRVAFRQSTGLMEDDSQNRRCCPSVLLSGYSQRFSGRYR